MTDVAKDVAKDVGQNLAYFPGPDTGPDTGPNIGPDTGPNIGHDAGWVGVARSLIEAHGGVVRASLIGVKGSAPRDAGAMMLITADDIFATVGGGALEYDVMAIARKMLADAGQTNASAVDRSNLRWQRQITTAALGPDMGQCCGGNVRVLLELLTLAECEYLRALLTGSVSGFTSCPPVMIAHPLTSGMPLVAAPADAAPGLAKDGSVFVAPLRITKNDLFLYGAGHIGRALVGHLAALECDVHWVDIDPSRFPAATDNGPLPNSGQPDYSIRRVIAADPTIIARHAPAGAIHLVMTHDHALDQAICHTVLADGHFARLGLIGSMTKAARFRRRLSQAGINADMINRLTCPIGMAEITGKEPARVALSIAAGVAIWQQELQAHQGQQTS